MRIIDMHVHTTASDGTFSPRAIVRLAEKVGLKAVAVTDHDTVGGITEAQKAAKHTNIEVIPGIEISVGETGSTHILGFYIDSGNPGLRGIIDILQQGRLKRNEEMIEKLRGLGYSLTLNDVKKLAASDNVGRLHIAQYIEQSGQAPDYRQFFKKYLSDGAEAYVHRKTVSEQEGIQAVLNAGGLPFLAHISYFNLPYNEIEVIVKRLISFGLKGIECYYSNYTKDDEEFCIYLCDKYGLLKSGGTDFHGNRRKGVYLGTGKGNMCVPYELLIPIKKAVGKDL